MFFPTSESVNVIEYRYGKEIINVCRKLLMYQTVEFFIPGQKNIVSYRYLRLIN